MGLTTAACLADLGHQVLGYDVDLRRIEGLQRGELPFHEPGLPELVARHRGRGLQFTGDLQMAVAAELLLVCVGTPASRGGVPDLSALDAAVAALAGSLRGDRWVVVKSTVPVGTNRRIALALAAVAGLKARVLSNPEFLREGSAVQDFLQPDRVVVGGNADEVEPLLELYRPLGAPLVVTSWEAAELTKYAANAYLATRLSFVHELAELGEALGVDITGVLRGIGLDRRIGPHFLQPGPGFGGPCLPKDLAALRWQGRRAGVPMRMLAATQAVNGQQRKRLLAKIQALLGELAGKTVAVWGLAFKAGTSDVRGAAAVAVLPWLAGAGAQVCAYDPVAGPEFMRSVSRRQLAPGSIALATDQWAATHGADCLLILTEWDQFRVPPGLLREHLLGDAVVDARNLLDPEACRLVGLRYLSVGRRPL